MGEAQSTKWILVTLLYLFCMVIVLTSTDALAGVLQQSSGFNYTNATFVNQYEYGTFKCETPRNAYFITQNGILQTGREIGTLEDACDFTKGIYSEEICKDIEGCTWQNVTTGFWIFTQTTEQQTCEGNINYTFYNNDTIPSIFTSPCSFPLMTCQNQTCQRNCENVGCNVVSYDYANVDFSATGIWQSLKDLATFSLDYNTDIPLLAYVLSIIGLYLPLILLIIQLRFLLPI